MEIAKVLRGMKKSIVTTFSFLIPAKTVPGATPTPTPNIVGYFCWVKTMRAEPTCEKRDKQIYDGKQTFSDTKRMLAEITLDTYDLTAEDWALPIDVLSQRYPCRVVLTEDDPSEKQKL